MYTFIKTFIIFIFSVIIGYATYELSHNYIIYSVNGNNNISFYFTYLNSSNKIEILTANENIENKVITKYLSKGTILSQDNFSLKEAFENTILLGDMNFFIRFLDSHQLKIKLYGKNNIALFSNIRVNTNKISIEEFTSYLKKHSSLKIIKLPEQPEIILIELLSEEVVLDVSSIFNPVKLTSDQLKSFDHDDDLLENYYLIFCILFTYLILFLFTKYFEIKSFNTKTNTKKLSSYNIPYNFYYLLLIITISLSIYTAFYIPLQTIMQNSNEAFFRRFIIFNQNFIPILIFSVSPLLLATKIKYKFIKLLLSFSVFTIFFILIIDNSLLISLGIRLNFNFGEDYAGDLTYIYDFVIKYIKSASGILCLYTILALLVAILIFTSKQLTFSRRFKYVFTVFLLVSIILGVLPYSLNSLSYPKLTNTFQINGISFYATGNVEKPYKESYPPRDNLNFEWKSLKGLNQQKNVIILIVESWSCNLTYICGSGPSYMPKIENLANQNTFFSNYHAFKESTSQSILSIIKSIPVITSSKNEYRDNIYKYNDLISTFNQNRYITRFISSTDHVFGMADTVNQSHFKNIILPTKENFPNAKDRYVFNSVNDNELFKFIINKIKQEKGKFLYITKTASNHSPYNSPLGFDNMELAFTYTDNEIFKFIKELKQINYFENGIVVLLGDHKAWMKNETQSTSIIEGNHTPLIIIDNNNQQKTITNKLTHASLGVIIQYLMLPEYKMNKFNVNPFENDKDEILFGSDYTAPNTLKVNYNNKDLTVILDGNDTFIKEEELLTQEQIDEILGYIAWFK